MLRRTLTVTSITSLVLCLAALTAWPLSYGWPFKVDWLNDFYGYGWQKTWAVASHEGAIWVRHFLPDLPDNPPSREEWRGWNFLGGIGYASLESGPTRMSNVWVRYWFIAAAAGLLPMIRFGPPLWRRRRGRRELADAATSSAPESNVASPRR